MKLSEEIKESIKNEYENWFKTQYGTTTKEERKKLGAVFTPPDITIQMIEKLESLNGNILDPCCGAGNLFAACIIAGADPKKVYGNEFEPKFVSVAQNRLAKLGVPKWHIHQGDATNPYCIKKSNFKKDYVPPTAPKQMSLFTDFGLDTDGANEEYEKMMSLMKSSD